MSQPEKNNDNCMIAKNKEKDKFVNVCVSVHMCMCNFNINICKDIYIKFLYLLN